MEKTLESAFYMIKQKISKASSLSEKTTWADTDLIVIEDGIDTKKMTVATLKGLLSVVGTFSPTLTGATTAGTCSYSTFLGGFTRIGKVITFDVEIGFSAHTGTGQLRCNIPSTVNVTGASFIPTSTLGLIPVGAGALIVGLISKGISKILFYTLNAGTLTAFNVPASGAIHVSGTYTEV